MIKLILLVSAGSFLLLPVALGQVLNTKLSSGQVSLRRICVMPAEADWLKYRINAREPMAKEADDWSAAMQPVISKALVSVGAEDVSGALGAAGQDENVRQSILQLQQKYDVMARLLHKDPGGTKYGRFTLGDEVSLAPCAAQADAIIFVRSQADIPLAFADSRLYVTMVDARSGEVLAHARVISVGNAFRKEPEAAYLNILVDRLYKMHVGTPRPKKK